MRNLAGFVIWKNQKFEENLKKFRSIRHFLSLNTNFGTCIKLKANKSQGRAHDKEVITRYRPSTLLTVAPMTRHFTKIWGPPNQSSPPPSQSKPQEFCSPCPPSRRPCLNQIILHLLNYMKTKSPGKQKIRNKIPEN